LERRKTASVSGWLSRPIVLHGFGNVTGFLYFSLLPGAHKDRKEKAHFAEYKKTYGGCGAPSSDPTCGMRCLPASGIRVSADAKMSERH
jgi:hypothetical protein